jgi:hypothetical protein
MDTKTHSMISVNGQIGTMIIYDNLTTSIDFKWCGVKEEARFVLRILQCNETFTSLRAKYITTTFNANTRKAIHIITICKPSTLSLSMFIIHLQNFLDLMPISCFTIIISDFNINVFDQNSTQPNVLQSFMDQY